MHFAHQKNRFWFSIALEPMAQKAHSSEQSDWPAQKPSSPSRTSPTTLTALSFRHAETPRVDSVQKGGNPPRIKLIGPKTNAQPIQYVVSAKSMGFLRVSSSIFTGGNRAIL